MDSEQFMVVLAQISQNGQRMASALEILSSPKKQEPRLNSYQLGDDFQGWSFHVEMQLTASGLNPPHSLYLILGALRGPALHIARVVQPEILSYRTHEAFLYKLKTLFVSPAHKEQARAAYERRVQGKREGIRVYHGLLLQLYNDAFGPEERRETDLIQHFIAGIQVRSLVRKIHDLKVIDKYPPSYPSALDICLHYMAEDERIDLESHRLQSRGYQAANSDFGYKRGQNRPEPMDIGACKLHPNAKHTNAECRMQKLVKTTQKPPQKGTWNAPLNKTQVKCNNCKKLGHYAKDCSRSTKN
jgi:hypothetical protein